MVRVYDDGGRKRGERRVLVDRLWPRGLSKESVDFDDWPKDVAPSTDLRRWYGHDPSRFDEFRRRYREELSDPPAGAAASTASAASVASVDRLVEAARSVPLILLTATRDVEHSGAEVLRQVLEERLSG